MERLTVDLLPLVDERFGFSKRVSLRQERPFEGRSQSLVRQLVVLQWWELVHERWELQHEKVQRLAELLFSAQPLHGELEPDQ